MSPPVAATSSATPPKVLIHAGPSLTHLDTIKRSNRTHLSLSRNINHTPTASSSARPQNFKLNNPYMSASNSAVSMEETNKGLYMCSAARPTRCGGELEEDRVPTLLFTAGTALAVLCLKRAVLASLGKQCWHVWWVFVLLNAILLVVLLTSMRSSSAPGRREDEESESDSEDDGERTPKKQRKGKLRQCSGPPAAVERARGEREESVCQERDGWSGTEERDAVQEEDRAGVYEELSDEELNERVETFIATFRQHLVSDARRR